MSLNSISTSEEYVKITRRRKRRIRTLIIIILIYVVCFLGYRHMGLFAEPKIAKVAQTIENIKVVDRPLDECKKIFLSLVEGQLRGSFMDKWKGRYSMQSEYLPKYSSIQFMG